MASPITRTVTVPLALDADALKRQLAILRNLCLQIGFALDTAILALDGPAQRDGQADG